MEPTFSFPCGCLITLIVFGLIWGSIFGRGFWLRIPWFGGASMPFFYVDEEMYAGEWTPERQRWRKKKVEIPPPIVPPPIESDEDFRDEVLERLIKDGRLRKAREYLQGMIDIAKEMKDKKCEVNYRQYEEKIIEASQNPERRI